MSETTTVRVPLTVEDRAGKADEMARLVLLIEGIELDKAAYAKKRNEEIKDHQAELAAIANVVQQGAEHKSQMALTFEESQRALAGVASAACSCEGGPEAEVKSAACAVHGVDSRGPNPAPCDGDHVAPVCGHPQCWLIEGPAEEPPQPEGEVLGMPGSGGAEVAADYVVPEAEHVDVGTVKGSLTLGEFRKAKAKRARARA